MFLEEFTIGVRDLMTTDIHYLSSSCSVDEALDDLREMNFTAAPIEGTTSPYYFTQRSELSDLSDEGHGSRDLLDHASQIDLKNLISPDADFDELIQLLEEAPVYFIGWNDRIEGIITRADLNKLASHTFLYSKINQVENLLRDVIDETTPDDIIDANSRYARKNFEADGDADLQLRLVDYTTFGDLRTIVKNHEQASEKLPYDRDNAVRILSDINKLRDNVAHHGNVIHIMEIDQSTPNNRDIRDLCKIYTEMQNLLDNA